MLSRQVLALLDDLRDPAIGKGQIPLFAALALEAKAQFASFDLDVPVVERGQPIAFILLDVISVADPDHCGLKQAHDSCQDLLSRQAAAPHVAIYPLAYTGQRLRKLEHMLVFVAVAHFTETFVIAILRTALCIASGRLNVAVGIDADPHVCVGRRNANRVDPRYDRLVGDPGAPRIAIAPALSASSPCNSGDWSET